MQEQFSSKCNVHNNCTSRNIRYRVLGVSLESVVEPEHRARERGQSGCGMLLIPVPMYGVKMSSKPSKWLFDITGGIRESFMSLDLFSLTFKNIFLALLRGRGAIALSPPPPTVDPPLLRIEHNRQSKFLASPKHSGARRCTIL